MGITTFFRRGPSTEDEIKNAGFEIAECDADCGTCHTKFPSSLSFQDDDNGPLFGSTKPYGLHIVVPTNKTDWSHDATGDSGTLAHSTQAWASSAKVDGLGPSSTVKVTVSSLCTPKMETDDEYMNYKRGDLLLFPFFVWVRNVTIKNVGDVLDSVVPKLVKLREDEVTEFPTVTLSDFPEVTVQADLSKSFIFLCSHRTRDKRCGVTAPIMKREMDMHLRDLGLLRDASDHRPDGARVAYVNHIGGHKYAANVIIYLRKTGKNIWLARCRPQNVIPIIDQCVVEDGKVWPEKVRQVQKYKAIEW